MDLSLSKEFQYKLFRCSCSWFLLTPICCLQYLGLCFADSQASSISTRSAGLKSAASSHSVELPDLPWSDWEIKAADINITKDSHGEPVKLGSGAYGTVKTMPVMSHMSLSICLCKLFYCQSCTCLLGRCSAAALAGEY